jgi:hypothetical protein
VKLGIILISSRVDAYDMGGLWDSQNGKLKIENFQGGKVEELTLSIKSE